MAEDNLYPFSVADFGFSDPVDAPPNNFAGVRITTPPAAGTLTIFGFPVFPGQFVPASLIAGGQLRFAPAPNANGSPYTSLTFQVQDDGGIADGGVDLDPVPNVLTINVTSVNDPPFGINGTVSMAEDNLYPFSVADFGFSDPVDAPPNNFAGVRITTPPAAGTLTIFGFPVFSGQFVPASLIAGGQLRFAPAPNANGSPYTSLTFQVQDDGGIADGGVDLDPVPNVLTITVTSVNDPPFGANGTVTMAEDNLYPFSVAAFPTRRSSDLPPNNFAGVRITTPPAAGTLTIFGFPVFPGQFVPASLIAGGQLRFAPAPNANGSPRSEERRVGKEDGAMAARGVEQDQDPKVRTTNVTDGNDP